MEEAKTELWSPANASGLGERGDKRQRDEERKTGHGSLEKQVVQEARLCLMLLRYHEDATKN